MKIKPVRFLSILALLLPFRVAAAGAISSGGGGVDVKMQIECDDNFRLTLPDMLNISGEPLDIPAWVQQPDQSPVYTSIKLNGSEVGFRSIQIQSQNSYCPEILQEQTDGTWLRRKTCKGSRGTTTMCRRVPRK